VKPLLVIDGDSLAHRAYHAMPKTVRLGGIVGFANMLLRLWQAEEPRAVLVGWDSIGEPTYRNEAFDAYQGGRVFDPELLEQLDMLPELVRAMGFAAAKGAGYEADDFLAAAVASEEARGGSAVVVTSDRDAFQLASERTTILQPVRAVQRRQRRGKTVSDALPVLRFHLLPRLLRGVAVKMWMPCLHLGDQTLSDIGERERAAFFGEDRMEEHLEQKVAQLLAQQLVVLEANRVVQLVCLLDEVGTQ